MENRVQRLYRRVENTRLSRIRAAERLRRWDLWGSIITVYYSLCIVALSIWNIRSADDRLALLLVIASVSMVIFSTWTQTLKLGERSLALKYHYIELQKLSVSLENMLEQIQSGTESYSHETISSLEENYSQALQNVENHLELDYWRVKLANRDSSQHWSKVLSSGEWLRFIGLVTVEVCALLAFLLGPVFLWWGVM